MHVPHVQLVLEDELAADDSTDTIDLKVTQSLGSGLRLNNNMLSDWEGFSDTVSRLFVDHRTHLRWLDLSFNDMTTIDAVIMMLMFYLYGER